ncbi:hypothetical protein [Haloplasma contractile]|uniref:Uncharacterized protein n=1 Tax=Haloplasma contractile SSD-17B TaxID=1033810 RepID=F7PWF6_9MOLU|nr:hypothetical protein [Haloplasma contractile]ERJ11875.1 hypothetical protein HLPCO_002115 [Haloplasma contractile SSD-17B]
MVEVVKILILILFTIIDLIALYYILKYIGKFFVRVFKSIGGVLALLAIPISWIYKTKKRNTKDYASTESYRAKDKPKG